MCHQYCGSQAVEGRECSRELLYNIVSTALTIKPCKYIFVIRFLDTILFFLFPGMMSMASIFVFKSCQWHINVNPRCLTLMRLTWLIAPLLSNQGIAKPGQVRTFHLSRRAPRLCVHRHCFQEFSKTSINLPLYYSSTSYQAPYPVPHGAATYQYPSATNQFKSQQHQMVRQQSANKMTSGKTVGTKVPVVLGSIHMKFIPFKSPETDC